MTKNVQPHIFHVSIPHALREHCGSLTNGQSEGRASLFSHIDLVLPFERSRHQRPSYGEGFEQLSCLTWNCAQTD